MRLNHWLTLAACTVLLASGCIRWADSPKAEVTEFAPALQDENGKPVENLGDIPSTGTYTVKMELSTGEVTILVHRDWAPRGAERFYQLVKSGFYDGCRFFRVLPNFMVQFGISGDPEMTKKWDVNIPDDPVIESNTPGKITFATAGPGTRTTQVFINYEDNAQLDQQGFSPFGEVIDGMDAVRAIESKYAEQPDQGSIESQGNSYLNNKFPDLDYVVKATIIDEAPGEMVEQGTVAMDAGSAETTTSPEVTTEPMSAPAEATTTPETSTTTSPEPSTPTMPESTTNPEVSTTPMSAPAPSEQIPETTTTPEPTTAPEAPALPEDK